MEHPALGKGIFFSLRDAGAELKWREEAVGEILKARETINKVNELMKNQSR